MLGKRAILIQFAAFQQRFGARVNHLHDIGSKTKCRDRIHFRLKINSQFIYLSDDFLPRIELVPDSSYKAVESNLIGQVSTRLLTRKAVASRCRGTVGLC